jgi:hypothetical protein
VALVGALAGTAVAEEVTTSAKPVTKKKAKKIAKKQVNKVLPIGAENLGTIVERTDSENLAPATGGVATEETLTVSCQTGEKVISGGWSTELVDNGVTRVALPVSDKRSDNGWEASAANLSTTQPNELTVYAYCLAPSP